MKKLKLGRYRHYKGKFYEVIGVAHHSETLEELVVYIALWKTRFGQNSLWVRPRKMFEEIIEVNGNKMPRFEFVEENK